MKLGSIRCKLVMIRMALPFALWDPDTRITHYRLQIADCRLQTADDARARAHNSLATLYLGLCRQQSSSLATSNQQLATGNRQPATWTPVGVSLRTSLLPRAFSGAAVAPSWSSWSLLPLYASGIWAHGRTGEEGGGDGDGAWCKTSKASKASKTCVSRVPRSPLPIAPIPQPTGPGDQAAKRRSV